MAGNKGKLYQTLYLGLVFVCLAGAWVGLSYFTVEPESGYWGPMGFERPFPEGVGEGPKLLEGAEIQLSHRGRACTLEVSDLPEGFSGLTLAGASREDILGLLDDDWDLVAFEARRLLIEYTGQLCAGCRELQYVGLYQGKIAIFQGTPPGGVLVEITDYDYKEIYREDLEKGIPFQTEAELESILESYTT
jgi:hypothetical protein